jgi:hypothetical protein
MTHRCRSQKNEDLILAAQAGHELAFQELFQRSSSTIFRMIAKITKNQENAEDALRKALHRSNEKHQVLRIGGKSFQSIAHWCE